MKILTEFVRGMFYLPAGEKILPDDKKSTDIDAISQIQKWSLKAWHKLLKQTN